MDKDLFCLVKGSSQKPIRIEPAGPVNLIYMCQAQRDGFIQDLIRQRTLVQQIEAWQDLEDIFSAALEVSEAPLVDSALCSSAADVVVVQAPRQALHLATVTPAAQRHFLATSDTASLLELMRVFRASHDSLTRHK